MLELKLTMDIKLQIQTLKTIQNKTNKNMHNFLRVYEKVFQMIDYGYDAFIDMDLITEEIYKELIQFVIENEIKMDFLPELVFKKWNHIVNSKKFEIQRFQEEEQTFDAFFWSYILVEIFIVLPYLMMHLRIQQVKLKHPDWDEYKIKKHLAYFYSPYDLYNPNKIFKRWDEIDQRTEKAVLDVGSKPPLCHVTYPELHKTFSTLFNYYYLVLEDDKITKIILRNIYLFAKLPWIFLIILIAIILGFGLGFGLGIHK